MSKALTKILKFSAIFFVAGFFFLISANTVFASTKTWTGSASSSWSNPTNWGGAVPSTGDDLVFPVGASNLSNTNDLPENTIINSITISGSGYTLSGNRIIIGAGLASITDSASSGGNTIALDVRLDVTRDIYVTNLAETLTFSGRISGIGGINKEGAGKLILSGTNTYGGITKINVGVINAQNSAALGTILAGTEVVGNAALELQGDINISYESLALRGFGVDSGGALRNISGTNSFGGLITLSTAGGAEISSDSGTLIIAGGTTGNFPLVLDGLSDITFSTTPLTGSGLITKNGSGTVRLNFPNTNTGTFVINAGTVLYGVNNALMTGAITVTGGTLDIATFSDMVGTVTLGTTDLATGTITGSTGVLSSTTWTVYNGTISAIIAGVGGTITKSTPGTVTLTRANLYTGPTNVSLGILKIQNSMALGPIDGITTVTAGATLQIDGTGLSIPEYITFSGVGHLYKGAIQNTTGDNTITGLLTLAAAGLIKSDSGTTLTVDQKGLFAVTFGLTVGGVGNTIFTSTAPIYGTSGSITKQDSGTLTLQALNNITGQTNINGGEIVLDTNGAIPLSTVVTINSGGTLTLDNTSSTTNVDRLAELLSLTVHSGNLNFKGSSSIATNENLGSLSTGISTQSGQAVVTVYPGAGGSTTLQFASLNRIAGSTVLFRGTSFGSTPGAGVSTLLFKSDPTLTGSSGLANSTTISIIAGAFGDDSTSGTGTDMVTYGVGNGNGLRLLNGAGFSGEYASSLGVANANVKLTTPTVAVTTSINSLILSGTGTITDAGTSQTITTNASNIINLTSGGSIAGANTTLSGNTEIKILDNGDLDLSGPVSGTNGLTKTGTGTLSFITAKNYTGLTSVNQGTLLYGIDNAILTGNVTVNGGTLDIATFSDTVGAVILQNGTITGSTGVLASSSSYSFREGTVSAIIGGTGIIVTRLTTNTAPDSVVLMTNNNTYTGATNVTSGILRIGSAGVGGNTPLGTVGGATVVSSTAALDLNGYTLATLEPLTLNSIGYGPSNLVTGGNGNMGALMNTSSTPVSYGGTITLASAARINSDAGVVTITSNMSGAFALTLGGFSDMNVSGNINTGAGTLIKDGIGTLTLSGSSSYTGSTTISSGTLKLGATGGATNAPLGTVTGATIVSLGAKIDLNGFTLGTAEPLTLNGQGYGVGDFASGALVNSSASSVTYSGLLTLGNATTVSVDSGSINLSNVGTISGSGLALTLGGSGSGTLTSIIGTVAGTLTKIGSGTWTLSASASTYTGATTISRGTLKLGAAGGVTNTPLGTAGGATSVLSGAALDLNGFTLGTAEGLTLNGRGVSDAGALLNSGGAVTFAGATTLATDSRIANNGSGLMTLSGAISGAFALYIGGSSNISTVVLGIGTGTLTKQGSGTITSTGSHTYTGETRVDAGSLTWGAATTFAATNLLMKGGVFDMGANADTIGKVTLVNGTIQNGTLTATTSYTAESGTISAILAGAVAFIKNTNNTVTLTGANTISSTTTINGGTVVLSGSGSAVSTTVTINLGSTLTLNNSATAVASRLGDALVLTMNGGNLNFIGNTAGTSSETIGALTPASGHNIVTVTPGAGGSTTLTAASLARTAGATVLFRGTNFGAAPAANVSTLMFTAAPTLTGGNGSSNSATVSIIKGAFGDTSLSGNGSDMVTYNVGNTNGLRPLNGAGFSGEYSATLTTNTNVKLTGNTAASTVSINSLILNGFGITDAGTAQTVTIAAAALSGNVLMNSATNIAGANTTLNQAALEMDILATNTSTISAVIDTALAGSLALSGPGTVTFSAVNLYTGTTFVNNATLKYGTTNALFSGGVTIVGGTFDLNGYNDAVGSISINAGTITTGVGTIIGNGTFTTIANNNIPTIITGNLSLGANATFTIGDGAVDNDAIISAVVSGAFTLAKAGTGTFILAGNNTYTGTTTVSAGILRLGSAGGATNAPLGTTAAGTTVSGASSALDLNGYTLATSEALTLSGALATGAVQNNSSASVDYAGLVTLGAASTMISNYGVMNFINSGNITGTGFLLTIGGAGNGTLASNINTSTAGALTKNGVGVWTISGSSNFTGVTTISAGTLKLGATGGATNTPLGTTAGATTITSGAIFDINGYTLGAAEPLTVNGTGIVNVGAFINSSNSSATYPGAITLGAASRIANHGSGVTTLNGNISGNFALTVVAVGDFIQGSNSVWSGTGSLVKEGSGTLTLTGQNSTTGAMTVSTGVLKLGASGGATNTPLGTNAGGVTVALGGTLDLATYSLGGASTYETLNISGTGIKELGAVVSSASGNTNFGAMTVAASAKIANYGSGIVAYTGTITIGVGINLGIAGSGPTTTGPFGATGVASTLTKWDSGTLTLNAAGQATGLIRVNGGTLAYGVADALGNNPVTIAGGTWDLKGFSEGAVTNIGAITLIDGSVINTGGAATINPGANMVAENGTINVPIITGAYTFTKNTGGTVTLGAANTFTGQVTVNAGTLAWGINDALPNNNLTVSGGTVDMATFTDTVGLVTLSSGTIAGSTGVLTSGSTYALTNGTVSGILGGSVGVNKTTNGAVTMSGSNTYSGTTTITAGVLRATSTAGLGDGSGTNTLIFSGGVLQAGGNITSPSTRAVTLTSTGSLDTNNYTISFAGTVGSAGGMTINGTGTFNTTGAVTLGAALNVVDGTFSQGGSLAMSAGTVTISTSGVWSNVGTGAVTLAGAVSNSGIITLNSNNGAFCVDGTNSILVRSSVNNTLRAWSGAGTFNLHNLDVDDMTGTITAYNSVFSGDTTWTNGSCVTISGTANGNNTATVKAAINGTLQTNSTGTISGGTWTIGVPGISNGNIITAWVDGVADNLESTAVTKYGGSGSVTGMVLDTNVLTIGSNQNNSVSTTNLGFYDSDSDEDIMHTSNGGALVVQGGTNTYANENLSILASNTLTVDSASNESISTAILTNAGILTATGTPAIVMSGNGSVFTNTGTFNAGTSTVKFTDTSSSPKTIAGGNATFSTLWINGATAGDYTITGSNNFTLFKVDASPVTIKFTAGTTQTVAGFQVNGQNSSSLVTLKSTLDGVAWNLSKAAGSIISSYLSLRDSTASGGASFLATSSIDVSGNSGWSFPSYGGGSGNVESSATPDQSYGGGNNGGGGNIEGGGAGVGTCSDQIQNGNETGVDTGGRCVNTGGGAGGGGGGDLGYLWKVNFNRGSLIASAGVIDIFSIFKILFF